MQVFESRYLLHQELTKAHPEKGRAFVLKCNTISAKDNLSPNFPFMMFEKNKLYDKITKISKIYLFISEHILRMAAIHVINKNS